MGPDDFDGFEAPPPTDEDLSNVTPIRGARLHDSRPVIQMTVELHRVVDASVGVLASDPDVYQRDATLVRIVRVAEAEAEREGMSEGAPQIRELAAPTLKERLTRHAQYQRFDARSKEWVPAMPAADVVSALHARGEWRGVRPIVGCIETPSLRPDGTVLDSPGYDAATGYVYLPGRKYPAVPAQPSHDDARRALAALAEPFQDFPVGSEAQRYVPVAALLTLVARPAIRGACPAFLYDATSKGSGKTLMTRAVTALAQGREAALTTWPPDHVELEKILGSYALRGASVIAWDNVVGTFGGGPLDKILTCSDRVELRVLGKSEVPALSWRAVTLAGGNNVVIGADTTRRVLVCRIEPTVERPEERTGFAIADLAAWCREHHPRIVAEALTLLRAYVVAGRPDQGLKGWGSFEAWSDLIPSALAWAGAPDVMTCRPTVAGTDDAETGALRVLLDQLPAIAPDGISAAKLIRKLYTHEYMRSEGPSDGLDGLREAVEALAPPKAGRAPTTVRLGKALQKQRGRVVGGRKLESETDRTNVQVWRVVGMVGS